MPNRRQFLKNTVAAAAGVSLPGWAAPNSLGPRKNPLRLIIVGGGVGGVHLARLLQHQSAIQATLFDPLTRSEFRGDSTALGSEKGIRARPHTMRTIHERVLSIDPVGRYVMDATGTLHAYDRLVLAPGIAYDYGAYEHIEKGLPAAWMRGPESAELNNRLKAMPSAGLVTITVPKRPYRYTEGPYLRALLIARWLKENKPGGKLLLIDENPVDAVEDRLMLGIRSMMDEVKGIEWRRGMSIQRARSVAGGYELFASGETINSHVLNLIPRQRASDLAERASLVKGAWCPRDPETLLSSLVDGVHIIGDSAWETGDHQKRAVNAQRDAVQLARLLITEAG